MSLDSDGNLVLPKKPPLSLKEVKDYLKDNLEIKLEVNDKGDYYGGGTVYITAKIVLDGEAISESCEYFSYND